MERMTKVWVVSDSMNHAVWNRGADALKKSSMMKKVAKSKMLLIGSSAIMKFLMYVMSHFFGLSMYSLSTWSVLIVVWLRS